MLTLTVGKADVRTEPGRELELVLSWYLTHNDCARQLGPGPAQTVITEGSSGNATIVHDEDNSPGLLHVIYEGDPEGKFENLGFGRAVIYRPLAVAELVARALAVNKLYRGCMPGT